MGFFNNIVKGFGSIASGFPGIAMNALTGGLGSLATSAVGAGLNALGIGQQKNDARSQIDATNLLNYQIWQEQKQHNIDMFNLQNQASIDMWNMQNEYNTPEAVMQRYRDAGINPYMAMSAGGTAGSATSAPATGQMLGTNPPNMIAPNPEYSTKSPLSTLFMNFTDNLLKSISTGKEVSTTENIEKDTEEKGQNIEESKSRVGVNKEVERKTKAEANIEEENAKVAEEVNQWTLNSVKATFLSTMLNSEAQFIMNQFLPAEKQMGLLMSAQDLYNKQMAGELTRQQAILVMYQQLTEQATTGLVTQNIKNAVVEGENLKKEGKRIDAQTAEIEERTEGQKLANDEKSIQNKILYDTAEQIIDATNAMNGKITQDSQQYQNINSYFGYLFKPLQMLGIGGNIPTPYGGFKFDFGKQ